MWGYEVVPACNGVEAVLLAESTRPDLIISDIWMPSGSGFSLAFRLKEALAGVPVIFLSASKQQDLKNIASELEAVAFLEKPYEPDMLLETIKRVLEPSAAPVPSGN